MGASCEHVSSGMSVVWVPLQWVTFSLDVSCALEPISNEISITSSISHHSGGLYMQGWELPICPFDL